MAYMGLFTEQTVVVAHLASNKLANRITAQRSVCQPRSQCYPESNKAQCRHKSTNLINTTTRTAIQQSIVEPVYVHIWRHLVGRP